MFGLVILPSLGVKKRTEDSAIAATPRDAVIRRKEAADLLLLLLLSESSAAVSE